MSMFFFPKPSYFKRNYKLIYYELSRPTDTFFVVGDWLDVYSYPSNLDLSTIFVKLNDGFEIPLSMLPVTSPFNKIEVINRSGITSGTVTLIVGEEFFRRDKQSVEITNDRTKRPDFRALEISVTSTPAVISDDSTYRDTVVLVAPAFNSDTVSVGDSPGNCVIPLPPGSSMSVTKTSLNKIYVKASSTQTLYVFTGGA